MNKKRWIIGITLGIVLAGACGGPGHRGKTCTPGDTRSNRGHTDICNKNGKWEPKRK